MAMKITRKLKGTKIDIVDAYCRVKAFRFDHPDHVYIEVGIYEDEESNTVLDTKEYQMTVEDFDGKDKINAANCYSLLKGKSEWLDAEDA